MKRPTPVRACAFTLIEVFFLVAVLAILVGLLLPALAPPRTAPAGRIRCVNNLKNVGLAYRIFATDHNDLFPWETNTFSPANRLPANKALQYFLTVSNELWMPNLLACPTDNRPPADAWTNFTRQNLSYFVSPDASEIYPNSFMAGDRNLASNGVTYAPGRVKIPRSAITNLAWSATQHKGQGNACMGDGSVQQLSSARLRDQFRNQGRTIESTTFLFP